MKVVIGLERIGDLLLSFASSAQAAGSRLDSQDARELTQMQLCSKKCLPNVGKSFSQRDVKKPSKCCVPTPRWTVSAT